MIAVQWAAVDAFASLLTRSCRGLRHNLVDLPQPETSDTPIVVCGKACGWAMIARPVNLDSTQHHRQDQASETVLCPIYGV
jgi:hypothetical protein